MSDQLLGATFERKDGVMASVHEALSRVKLEVGAIPKADKAPKRAGGFAYRGIDAIRNATHGPMARHGVTITRDEIVDKTSSTYTSSGGTEMRLVSVEVRYLVHGPAGDTLVTHGLGAGSDSGSRAERQAMIDAYKDMLEDLLNLATDSEDPEQSGGPAPEPQDDRSAIGDSDYETIPLDYVKGLLADTRELGIEDEQVWKKLRGFARAMTLPAPVGWDAIHTDLREPLDQWVGEIEGAEDSEVADDDSVPF